MPNPLDDPEGSYRVLVNDAQQQSLWPGDLTVPAGWSAVFGPETRDTCLGYVETHWTDIRPAALRTAR